MNKRYLKKTIPLNKSFHHKKMTSHDHDHNLVTIKTNNLMEIILKWRERLATHRINLKMNQS